MARKKATKKSGLRKKPDHTVGDWIGASDGSKVLLVFESLTAENEAASLADLKAELEAGLATVDELIGDVGGNAQINHEFNPH